jgi:hypothetical protein
MESAHIYAGLNDPPRDEFERYVALMRAALHSGDTELADRFENYLWDLRHEGIQELANEEADRAWQSVQDLTRSDNEQRRLLFAGFQGGRSTEPVLARIRQRLLGQEDLAGTDMEQLEDGTTRYSMPMKGAMQYLESYDPPDGHGHRFVEVEVKKAPSSAETH